MPTKQAVMEAKKRGLDLIEVAPNADPPVCRMMDHGKFRYEQQKKAKEAKKKSKQTQLKSIRVRPNTDEHDVNFKMRNARKFLEKGDMVKFNVIFRGPELRHKDRGAQQLKRFAEGCEEVAVIEQPPRMEGRRMTMVLRPKTQD
jgi:translation initiation factor IF-3